MKISWSGAATRDVDEIWNFIADDNPDAADGVVSRFHEALTLLARQPRLGRRGRVGQTREFAVSGTPYIVIYDVTPDTIEVRRVMHGARDWPRKS